MPNNTWTYIAALGSVAFGWSLNEFGQWIRSRKEDKRIKRKVLFILLEIHYTFTKLDIYEDLEIIEKNIKNKIPESEQTPEFEQFINKTLNQHLYKMIEASVKSNTESLEETYKKAIEGLAEVDPVTAFRLNGKNKILENFGLLNMYFDSIKGEFPEEIGEINSQTELIMQKFRPEIVKSGLKELEKEIKGISYSIGFLTFLKVEKTIKSRKKSTAKISDKEIDKYFSNYFSSLTM